MGLANEQVSFKKKKSHDIAYLVILLAMLFATFVFAMVFVNSLLRNLGV